MVAAAREHGAAVIALADPAAAERARSDFDGAVLGGQDGVVELVRELRADIVLNAIVGAAGLEATMAALDAGSDLALANKESLVAGGELVTAAVRRSGRLLLPVDSEHSALQQCLEGAAPESLESLVLTASGGPFRGWSQERLADVVPAQALAHPTWSMGAKITIDSATLMNKGLELIEAHHLFGVGYPRIEVVVHPQSIVHGMARFRDGALIAHLGLPDMRVPISYALTYPERAATAGAAARPVAGVRARFRAARSGRLPVPGAGPRGRRGGRHRALRAERRQRGGGGRVPGRRVPVPADRRHGRRRARPLRARAARVGRTGAGHRRRRPGAGAGRAGGGRVSYIIPILGLLGLVFLHELGHFTAAKRTGMRALKFYVGFPPPLVRKRVGETEYGIGVVPLGGFVKIPGMLRPEPSDLWAIEDLLHRSESLPPERASEIGIAYDRLAQLVAQGRVDEAAPAAGELGRLIDETEGVTAADRRRVSRCLSRFVESTDPRGYWRSSRPKRLIVIGAGPFANILFAFLLLTGLAITGLPQPLQPTAVVAGLEKGLPAQKAGLRAHDRIVAIDGHPITGFDQVRALISTSGGHPVSLTVRRNGTTVHLGPITPVKQGGRYIVGFLPDVIATTRSVPVWKAPGEGASQMWKMISGSVTGIRSEGTSSLSGPVGIVRVSASAADTGAPYYLWLLAYISLSLGILNLLPFLPLDGGHILLVALEKIRGGRPLSRATFERVSMAGIALVLFLFLFGLHNDLLGAQPR